MPGDEEIISGLIGHLKSQLGQGGLNRREYKLVARQLNALKLVREIRGMERSGPGGTKG